MRDAANPTYETIGVGVMGRHELFNGISHMIGAALALAGAVVLVVFAAQDGETRRIVAFSVYGASLFLLYLASTLYHSLSGRAKHVFRVLDHQAIYLLIAGTYTPFTLITLKDSVGWWLFGAVWAMAVLGLVLDALPRRGARIVPFFIYLAMGWLMLLALDPLLAVLQPRGVLLVAHRRHPLHLGHRVFCPRPALPLDARGVAPVRAGR